MVPTQEAESTPACYLIATVAFTNTYCPARKAASAMTNSARCPSVAVRRLHSEPLVGTAKYPRVAVHWIRSCVKRSRPAQ
jgi:hypothetical protein